MRVWTPLDGRVIVRYLVDGGRGVVDGGGPGDGEEDDITGEEAGHRQCRHRGEVVVGVGACVFYLLMFSLSSQRFYLCATIFVTMIAIFVYFQKLG